MSINTVLTSRQTQFKNYFQDGITIPGNANVALTKFSLDVPVFKQTVLTVPAVDPGDYNDAFLTVFIDGIEKDVTWQNLFDAFVDYPVLGNQSTAERDITIAEFYSGIYEFFLNNNLYLSTDGNAYESKCPIMWAIARAIQEAYQFYTVENISEYDDSFTDIPEGRIDAVYDAPVGAVAYTNSYIRASNPIKYSLNVSYNPNAIAIGNVTTSNFLAADVLNWTVGGVGNRLTSTAGALNIGYGNGVDIDLNGGYIITTPTLAAGGSSAFGLVLQGHGSGAGDVFMPSAFATMDLATPLIDIGIQYEFNGANTVFKIIDGQQQHINYNGATFDIQNLSVFRPYVAVNRFTNANDRFAILVKRGNIIDGNYSFVFEIKMGAGANVTNYTTIYTGSRTVKSGMIRPVPMFISSNTAGNIFNDIDFIQTGADTVLQIGAALDSRNPGFNSFRIGFGGSEDLDKPDYRDFLNGIGLNYRTSGGQVLVAETSGFKISYEGTPTNKIISWDPAVDDNSFSQYLQSFYWIGERNIRDFYVYDTGQRFWSVDRNLALTNLPKYLDVFLLNHTNKNYSGSFITQGLISNMDGEDRLVGTIPFPQQIPISQVVSIQYETFNPYYRPINNPQAYVTNEFIIEVSYKDFITNIKKTIRSITGTLRLELNFKKSVNQNVKRLTARNDLLPII